MIDNTGSNEFETNASEENVSQNEAIGSSGLRSNIQSKLKDYGKKSFSPLIEVLHKYQGEIGPYFSAISKGLEGGVSALNAESATEADKFIGLRFREAMDWLNEMKSKLDDTDAQQLISYLESEARRRPAFMFSLSYLAGLSLGRIGRYVASAKSSSTDFSSSTSTDSGDFSGENDYNPSSFTH